MQCADLFQDKRVSLKREPLVEMELAGPWEPALICLFVGRADEVEFPLDLSRVQALVLQHPFEPVETLEHVILVRILEHLADKLGDRLSAAQRQLRDDLNNALRTAGYRIPALGVADAPNYAMPDNTGCRDLRTWAMVSLSIGRCGWRDGDRGKNGES